MYLKQPKKVVDFHFQTLFMKLRKAKESSINIQTAYCLNTLSESHTPTLRRTNKQTHTQRNLWKKKQTKKYGNTQEEQKIKKEMILFWGESKYKTGGD